MLRIPLQLLQLLLLATLSSALFSAGHSNRPQSQSQSQSQPIEIETDETRPRAEKRAQAWVVVDVYQGEGFFDDFVFWDQADPTHGSVNYLNKSAALSKGLAAVTADNKAVMRVDNVTDLPLGQNRDSVRISSAKNYTGGLFLLDVEHAPWGCGVWPALWTVGAGWPLGGEIDIYEGVNLGTHNQVTFHTEPNCTYNTAVNQTGSIIGTNCDAFINDNSGCGITDPSQTSFGAPLNALGGGVFAMKWDEDGIMAWFFHRSSIPPDVTNGDPQPAGWGYPTASLSPAGCNPWQYFNSHSIVFDMTLCGDWAGSAYASSGCPGTCETQVMKGANFVNASWVVNSLIVFREASLGSRASAALAARAPSLALGCCALFVVAALMLLQ